MPQGTSTNQATTIKIPFFMRVNSKPCLMAYKGSIAILWQFLSKISPDFSMQIVMVLSCTQTLIFKKWCLIKQGLKLMKLLSQCQQSVPLYGNEHFALPYGGRHFYPTTCWACSPYRQLRKIIKLWRCSDWICNNQPLHTHLSILFQDSTMGYH